MILFFVVFVLNIKNNCIFVKKLTMKELEKLIKKGISRKYICGYLEISFPTLRKRLKDGKFKEYQLEKIKKLHETL